MDEDGAAKKNGGVFENGLLKAYESEHVAGGSLREVKVVANGHSHSTSSAVQLSTTGVLTLLKSRTTASG